MRIWQSLLAIVLLLTAIIVNVSAADLETSISKMAEDISDQMNEKQARKLAVVGFTDLNGYKSALGDFVSEELITSLVNTGKFDIVERRELDRVLSEHEMYADGIFDQSTIGELQKLLGIEAIVTGSITNLGAQIKINSRSISVETAKIFAAASVRIDRDPIIDQLLNQATNAGSSTKSSTGGFSAQRSDVYFKNSFLHVAFTGGIKREDTASNVEIMTEFRNMTNEPLRIGGDAMHLPTVISDAGDSLTFLGITGLAQTTAGASRKEEFTVIDPGSHVNVVLKFASYGDHGQSVSGKEFSFSLPIVRFESGRASLTTIGLSRVIIN